MKSFLSLLDDIVLQRRDEGEDLTFLFLRHLELIERGGEMFGGGVPIRVCDSESTEISSLMELFVTRVMYVAK